MADRVCHLVTKIFRSDHDSNNDGELIAENCFIVIDEFNVLTIHSFEDTKNNLWQPQLHFCLNDSDEISFKKIRSANGNHVMGRIVLKGRFGLVREKITLKMDLEEFDRVFNESKSWP